MVGNSFHADRQALGDGCIVAAARYQIEDLALAVGEFRENLGQQCGARSGEEVD